MLKKLWKLKRSRLLLLFPAALLILFVVKSSTFVAEYVFARGIYKILSLPLGLITRMLPFSLAELIILLIPVAILIVLALFVRSVIKAKGSRAYIFARGILNLLCAVSVVIFSFILLCGTNYYRYDFETYCDFDTGEHTTDELYDLCVYLKEKAEESKSLITDIDDSGVVTISGGFSETASGAQKAMTGLSETYPVLKYSTGGAKEVLMSRYMSYGSIVGIFIPFTMEANVNTDVADYNRPADTCHELAHMRGFMKEEEANYISYLACVNYDDPVFQYSGYMLAFIHSTNALYKYDAASYYEIMDSLSDNIRADIDYENRYWKELRENNEVAKAADSVVTSVNDTYLKVNGQSDGVNSYGKMVDLLLADFLTEN